MGGIVHTPEVTPRKEKLNLKDISQKNIDRIWHEAVHEARKYANNKGISLSVVAELTSYEKRHINMAENQKITLLNNVPGYGSKDYLIKPEKNHLIEMKSVNEIFQEFKDSINSFIEENNNFSYENYNQASQSAKNRLTKNSEDKNNTVDPKNLEIRNDGILMYNDVPIYKNGRPFILNNNNISVGVEEDHLTIKVDDKEYYITVTENIGGKYNLNDN